MKIRNGFVSNSSSSSFTCFTTIDLATRAKDSLSEEQQEIMDDILRKHPSKFLGAALKGYESSDCHGCSYIGSREWNEEVEEAAENWKDAVIKLGGDEALLCVSVDM
jgi:hypothetical protein